jgi:hypothetical protein
MNSNKHLQKRGGLAIMVVVFCVLVLAILGIGLLTLGYQTRLRAVKTASEIIARSAADAGLARVVYMANVNLINGTLKTVTYPIQIITNQSLEGSQDTYTANYSATYTYYLNLAGGIPPWSDQYHLFDANGVGTCSRDGTQRTVHAWLGWQSPFMNAIGVKGNITLSGNPPTLITPWVTANPPQPTTLFPPLTVRTNSTNANAITMSGSAQINGDAAVGVGGDPSTAIKTSGFASITGARYAASTQQPFSSVSAPSGLPNNGSLSLSGNTTTLSSSGRYSSITMSGSAIVNITAPITLYVTGSVDISGFAQLNITSTGSLTLCLGGSMTNSGFSQINNLTQIPANLQMYGLDTCTSVTLSGFSPIYAAVYAPNADITLSGINNFYGAFEGKTFTKSGSTMLYYDASLRNLRLNLPGASLVVTRWWE